MLLFCISDHGRSRTLNLLSRNQVLYPIELHGLNFNTFTLSGTPCLPAGRYPIELHGLNFNTFTLSGTPCLPAGMYPIELHGLIRSEDI